MDAFRVLAMLFIIVGHSEFSIGLAPTETGRAIQLALNIVGRFAVPLFFVLAGEHLGPRLIRDRAPGAAWPYVRRLGIMFVGASLFFWATDIAKLARRRGLSEGFNAFLASHTEQPLLTLFYGARPHLWFLAELIMIVLVAAAVLGRSRVRIFVLFTAVLYGLGLAIGPYAPAFGLTPQHWALENALQSPLFFAIGVVLGVDEHPRTLQPGLALLLGGLVVHAWEVHWLTGTYHALPFELAMVAGTVAYATGVAAVAMLPGPTPAERWLARAGPYVPAVYLFHGFFIETLRPPAGVFDDTYVRIAVPTLTVILAFGSAWSLARLRTRMAGARRRRPKPPAAAPATP